MSSAGWSAVTTSSSVRWPCCASVWSSRSEAKASPRSRSATWSEQKLTPTSETPRCRGRWSCSSRCMESTEEEETTEEEEERVFEDRRKEKDGVCGRRRWSRQEISRPSKASNPEGNQLGREIKQVIVWSRRQSKENRWFHPGSLRLSFHKMGRMFEAASDVGEFLDLCREFLEGRSWICSRCSWWRLSVSFCFMQNNHQTVSSRKPEVGYQST